MAVITITNLTKQFGGLIAVENLDIEVKEQSIHSVIGPNGAGKTTLFNCITGFYRPEIGDIRLDDHSLVGLLPDQIVRHGIARTYQNIRLFPDLTAMENILVGMHSHLRSGYFGIVLGLPATRKEETEGQRRSSAAAEIRQSGRQGGPAGEKSALRRISDGSRLRAPSPPGPKCCAWTSPLPA